MKWLFISLPIVAIIGATTYYRELILEPDGKQYISNMKKAVADLDTGYRHLAAVSEKLLLESPSPDLGNRIKDIQILSDEAQNLRSELGNLKQSSLTLSSRPYGLISANYSKSLELKSQSEAVIDQTNEVLDEYNELLNFLTSYYAIRQRLDTELSAFNSLDDLNVLAGRSSELEQIATELDKQTSELSKIAPPRGLESISQHTVTLHSKVANGFRKLASSLSPPVDAAIYSAAAELEELTNENSQLGDSELDSALENSPIMSSISDLPEITDRFKL